MIPGLFLACDAAGNTSAGADAVPASSGFRFLGDCGIVLRQGTVSVLDGGICGDSGHGCGNGCHFCCGYCGHCGHGCGHRLGGLGIAAAAACQNRKGKDQTQHENTGFLHLNYLHDIRVSNVLFPIMLTLDRKKLILLEKVLDCFMKY